MQSQVVCQCQGCRVMLSYPRGANNVRCALCSTITLVSHPSPPQGMDMAHIVCGGCATTLMYTRGPSSVRCSCCQTLNLVPGQQQPAPASRTAHINCGNCRITLIYPFGAQSVKCAVCQFVTTVNMCNGRFPHSMNRPNGTVSSPSMPSSSTTLTVVVENPMSVDESGKLVSNVVVGVKTDKK